MSSNLMTSSQQPVNALAARADQPPIMVPAVTLDGPAHGNFPATDGSSSACHFIGSHTHHQVPNAGHNLPRKLPTLCQRDPGTDNAWNPIRRRLMLLTGQQGPAQERKE